MGSSQLLFALALVSLAAGSLDSLRSFSFEDNPSWPLDGDSGSSRLQKPPRQSKSWKKQDLADEASMRKSAYCQEISSKDSHTRCFKCKHPDKASSYEQCSYSSSSGPAKKRDSRSSPLDSWTAGSSAYRFGAEAFEADTAPLPEPQSSASDNCKRVRRDSMLCMVCKEPKTNAKYEQCSYVGAPSKQQRGGSSTSRPRPEQRRRHRQQQQQQQRTSTTKAPEAVSSSSSEEQHTYLGYPNISGYESEDEAPPQSKQAKHSSEKLQERGGGCRKVRKDGETCTVCTDPRSGAKSEKCNYAFEPKDKAYAYSKSSTFGYPEGGSSGGGGGGRAAESEDEAEYQAEHAPQESSSESAEDYSSSYASPQDIRSESERISKQVRASGDCREERRDSMICKICKHPRSGDDFEQCNYSYEPEDKVYAYSRSKHAGSASSPEDEAASGEETSYSSSVPRYLPRATSQEHSGSKVDHGFQDASERRARIDHVLKAEPSSQCKQTRRGAMSCYSCRDHRDVLHEECVFVSEPQQQQQAEATSSSSSSRRRRRSSGEQRSPEQMHEAEAYEETRPMYDKVLGLTLPAYMVKPSPLELDFDRSVDHSSF